MESTDQRTVIAHLQGPLQAQQTQKHKPECHDNSRYTIHSVRDRQIQGWLGQVETIPINRARCQCCRAVFTVLPSSVMRYSRQDTDCLGKLLELNLGIGLSLRETATIYSWLGTERGWSPGWVWSLVQWLRNLLPVCLLLMQMGLPLPSHLLSDEKFAVLEGEKIYLFLVSQGELIWYGQWMERVDEQTFQRTITQFLSTMNQAGRVSGQLTRQAELTPDSVTTDGWQAAHNAWGKTVPAIDIIECTWHGQVRIGVTLDELAQAHLDWSAPRLKQVKDDLNAVMTAPSLAAFSATDST